jgi:hypothetical protein
MGNLVHTRRIMIVKLKSSKKALSRGGPFGFTLVEVIVSAALAALIGIIFAQSFQVISRFLAESDAKSSLKEAGDRITGGLNNELASSVRVFGRRRMPGTTSFVDDYSSFVDLTGCPPPLPGSKLRTLNEGVGTGTGNILFMAKELPPLELTIGGVTRRIDRYIFIFYYVSLNMNGRPFGTNPAQHLYKWESIVYANANQISNLPMGERPSFIVGLKAKDIHFAYDMTQTFLNNAFFSLNAAGTMSLLAGPQIQRNEIIQVTKNMGSRYLSGFSWGIDVSGFNVYAKTDNTDQIEVKVALIAQGAFPGFKYYETFSYCDLSRGR